MLGEEGGGEWGRKEGGKNGLNGNKKKKIKKKGGAVRKVEAVAAFILTS